MNKYSKQRLLEYSTWVVGLKQRTQSAHQYALISVNRASELNLLCQNQP